MVEAEALRARLDGLRYSVGRLPRPFRRSRTAKTFFGKLAELDGRLSDPAIADPGLPFDLDADADADGVVWLTQAEAESLIPTLAEEVAIRLGVFERNLPALIAALQVLADRDELVDALLQLLASTANEEQVAGDLVSDDVDRGPPRHLVLIRPAQPHAPPSRSGAPLERARADRLAA